MSFSYPSTEYTLSGYIQSKSDLSDKITAIENLETLLMAGLLDFFSGPAVATQSYELDDGQVRVKTAFRSMAEMKAALELLRIEKNKYINNFNGRTFVLQDKRTLR
ncbi:MAG TPA: hypothetical protein VK890_10285 [Bacteroidia bacterium]|jgi:hypothetical protein|nr:hypothetical protein [Bacteroidia bacterium]